MRISKAVMTGLGAGALLLAIVGCGGGGDDETSATQAQAPAQPSGGGSLTIGMSDYAFSPSDATTSAGTVKISAPNQGKVPHELVLLKTNQSPGSLPTSSNGEVDEEGLEAKGVESPGEIEDVSPGETKSADLKLTPGKYVMICNLPGHYKQGMYGTLTVK
jgi:uncharacterized cupredoxin-like copper-binding protein